MARRPLLPILRSQERVQNRTVERHLNVPKLLKVEWVHEVPQVRSSAEQLPANSPCQINCNRSLQASTAEEAKERTLTLDSILRWTTTLMRNIIADEQHENIRGDCIRNVSVCDGHGLLFSRRRV